MYKNLEHILTFKFLLDNLIQINNQTNVKHRLDINLYNFMIKRSIIINFIFFFYNN